MTHRLTLLIISLIACLTSQAQLATGSWKQFPVFGEFTDLVDTDDKVWYVTGGCLYSYDKSADETRFYEGGKELSGFTVKFMRHHPGKDIVAVAFTDGNMDLIMPDGSKVNLPEIKDAIVNVDKTINDIVFYDDEMYVATGFGLVIYDLNRQEVKESGIYHTPINSVIVTPKFIVIAPSNHNNWVYDLLCIKRGTPINNFDKFKMMGQYYNVIQHAEPLNEERTQFAAVRYNRLGSIQINDDGTFKQLDALKLSGANVLASHLSRSADGTVRFIDENGVIGHYVNYSTLAADIALPEEFKGNMMSAAKDLSSVWLADAEGLGNYRVSDNGGMTVLRDKSVPSGSITFNEVCNIFPSNTPGDFYIANMGMTRLNPVGSGDRFDIRLCLNKIENGIITNINPNDVTAYTSQTIAQQKTKGKYIFSPTQIAEDPDRPNRLYIGTGAEGVYVVENNQEIAKFDGNNSPMNKMVNYMWAATGVSIDPEGNLWLGIRGYANENTIIMLPAEKRRVEDPKTISSSDWIIVEYNHFMKDKDMHFLFSSFSDMMFGIDGNPDQGFIAINQKGTRSNISDDVIQIWSSPIDQDNKYFPSCQFTCLAEDQRGHVWMGTTSGVISITNPAKACDADFRINRIKVPRNDGSGLADYLLESDKIVAIAVDNSNRKWLGTEASGLFLVSENGDEIISHFTTDNSPLPSNTITALYADPTSSSIFIGTLAGLYEYSSTSGPAKADYSEAYAYPNPVTPDYSGWITIAGLMNSSLVKIVDSSMNLVYQTTSEGGTAMWDGCDISGSRVRSGVYYVLASTQSDSSAISSSSTGDVVAKILIVN